MASGNRDTARGPVAMGIYDRLNGDLPEASPEKAAGMISDDATMLIGGFGSVGYPKAIPEALAGSDRDLSLTVVSGGSTGDEVDTALSKAEAIARRFPYQSRQAIRKAVNAGEIAFHDRHIAGMGDEVRFGGLVEPDVALVEAVAVGDDWLVPSMAIGPTPDFVAAADQLLVEVNDDIPLGVQRLHDVYRQSPPPDREPIPLSDPGERIGNPSVTFAPEKLAAVVRTNRTDMAYDFRAPNTCDRAIADNLAEFLSVEVNRNPVLTEAVNLQFGVGSLGNALMGRLSDIDFGDREVSYYGELIQDGLVDMIDEGQLSAASATALAISPECRDRLFGNIDRFTEHIVLRPGSVSNDAGLINRFGVIAINTGLEVDVYGHVNSTHVDGTKLINGIGGSGDFNRNSHLAITVLGSTARDGRVSRITPMAPHVDHTEHDIQVIITEHGVADLRGLSPRERATSIVTECAHPDFRPQLQRYLDRADQENGHIPHDFNTVFSWQEH